MNDPHHMIRDNKFFYIITQLNIIIQTFIIYYLPHIKNDTGFNNIIYMIYCMNYFVICPITNCLFDTYLFMNIIFDAYYFYMYIKYTIYIPVLWYIIVYNTGNMIYMYNYKLSNGTSLQSLIYENNIIYNSNNVININDNVRYNPGDIILTDDENSTSSDDTVVDIVTDPVDIVTDPVDIVTDPVDIVPEITGGDNTKDKTHSKLKDECVICFTKFSKKMTVTTKCGHMFHKTCLNKWLTIDNVCPICRKDNPLGKKH